LIFLSSFLLIGSTLRLNPREINSTGMDGATFQLAFNKYVLIEAIVFSGFQHGFL